MFDTNDPPATQGEAYNEMVRNLGSDRPDHQWILTSFDTWERNPSYVGPDQPHPESGFLDEEIRFANGLTDEELEKLTAPDLGDDPRLYPGEENTPDFDLF